MDAGRDALHEPYRLADYIGQPLGRLAYQPHEALEKNKIKVELFMKKTMKTLAILAAVIITAFLFCVPAYATTGDVAGAVEDTWTAAAVQVKAVVNNVVFPVCATILAIFFFVKLGTAYFDYRKHGQFEWAGPAILFGCLVFIITAPLYIWNILGI
jgi:uncharacterized membrane protein